MSNRAETVRAYDDGVDRWRIAAAAPDTRLTGLVDLYGAWEEQTGSFTTRRELASTRGVLIVNLGADLEIDDARGQRHRFAAGEGFVGGMAEATSLSRSTGAMAGVHVHAPLPRLAALLGVSLADLANRVIRLEEVVGAGLGDRVAAARDDAARYDVLDGFFMARAAAMRVPDARLEGALAALARAGSQPVERAAGRVGWTRKHLAQRVRDATGLLPRAYVRLARFERFSAALAAAPDAGLADLAADAGYADQAHLARDVRRLTATTPSDLRARLIPAGGGVRDD